MITFPYLADRNIFKSSIDEQVFKRLFVIYYLMSPGRMKPIDDIYWGGR